MEYENITNDLKKMNIIDTQQTEIEIERQIENINTDMNKLDLDEAMQIDNEQLVNDVFHNDLDIYDAENRILCLGVPNVYCSKYFDDEDFIYSKIRLCKIIKENLFKHKSITEHVETLLESTNIIIDYGNSNLDLNVLYAKSLYIYQYVNYYYVRLRYLSPQERLSHLPNELPQWIENIVNIIKHNLDNELQHYLTNLPQEQQYLREIFYGLNLIVCHLKMILNHHRLIGASFYKMNPLHAEKLLRLTNNMCCIIIFANYLSNHGC